MPWKCRSAMECRQLLVKAVESGTSVAQAAKEAGVSRQVAHEWLKRHREGGDEALNDLSRAPHAVPGKTPDELIERCLQLRRQNPTWGPKKVRAWLAASEPDVEWPSASTVGEWLDRAGLVERRKWRVRFPGSTTPLSHAEKANDVWSIDFRGQFRLGNGAYCYPLTVTDNATRFLLLCTALTTTSAREAREPLRKLFQARGLPAAIRSDNGSPFATHGVCGLSALSALWRALGIRHERIAPGHPEQNGRHERMHLTLKQETTRPAAHDQSSQQQRFDRFQEYFNHRRPHEAIGQVTPGSLYQNSTRRWDGEELSIEYDTTDDVKHVAANGSVKWRGTTVHIGDALVGFPIGFKEISDNVWQVHFTDLVLGILEPGETRLSKPQPG